MPCGHQPGGAGLVGLSLFDLLLPAAVLPLLDVLLLPLLLLLCVPMPAPLLAGLLHGLELVLHVALVRVLGHVAAGHGPTGPQQLLWGESEGTERSKVNGVVGAPG